MLDHRFTIAYIVLSIPVLALELWGIRRKQKGDTITENVRWLTNHSIVAAWFVLGFCVWLPLHFFAGW